MIESGTLLQNRYRVTAQIGQGGMGAVYLAIDERFRSTVAVKQTFFDDPELLRAFEREAILLNRLRHAALPRVSDHFTEGAGQFLVMEFIEGSDFSELLQQRGGPFPLADVLRWADELLDALEYLHTQEPPVVHRDIKPQNLKLTPQGRVILLDFGLAKGDPAGQTRAHTTASVFGYSRNYAPLEQIQGTGTDYRSDLYSLAATLYHLLTGQPPADALTRAGALINNQPDPLRPAHRAHHQVSAPVGDLLHRAMALNPALRPRSAAELRAALRQAAAATRQPAAPSAYTRARAAADEATMLDAATPTPQPWSPAPPAHAADTRGTTQMRRPSTSQTEATVVDGVTAVGSPRRPGRSYEAAAPGAPPARAARKSPVALIVAAAVVLIVAVAAVPLVLMRQTPAPATEAGKQDEASSDAPTDEQTDSANASRAGEGGESARKVSGASEATTQGQLTPASGETQSPAAQAASRESGGPDSSGASSGASGASSEDAGALSAGGSGLVLQQAAPSSLQANAEEEARRADEHRRERQRAEDQSREQARPANALQPQQAGPPPGGGWHPPPHHRPPPPPRDRRFP